jgi:hypothetical protein
MGNGEAHTIYMREWRKRNYGYDSKYNKTGQKSDPGYARKAQDAWRKKYPEKRRAHQQVYWAVKNGALVRPDTCSRCGVVCRVEASHNDYSKPLDVEWLCHRCHTDKDRRS